MIRQQILTTINQQRQLLPLLLLTAFCIDIIITANRGSVVLAGNTYDFVLTTKHYIALGATVINFFIYIFLRPLYKYTLALTIAFGICNFMTFTALTTTSTNSFHLNSLNIAFTFQPTVFLAGLLGYIINFKRIN